ncbi:lipid droplet-associated protein [Nocardia brasiliensis]|uniref:lipid droplet-associated protein n=1 Tax=Nocardia brasiliensis TaxID=37326 RepID=UPI00189597E6|nr:lipid droplet-associated protein [Nocardia brasiliensis]MBF6124301.1 lipid droplet-associated protein [Nocardia brasiliensis]
MFRPPFLARVAAGAAVYAIEETRRLPTAAMNLPITAISQLLQTTMHVQQFVTSLALKGDAVFDRLANTPEEQPEWATFDEDLPAEPASGQVRASRFDLYADDPEPASFTTPAETRAGERNGHGATVHKPVAPVAEPEIDRVADPAPEIREPEVATRYDYANMTLAQLRARLRMLSLEDLSALLEYEQQTLARAPFVTMLTNRIATVRAQ